MVRQELNHQLQHPIKKLSGLSIFTTLDPVTQTAAQKAFQADIPLMRRVNYSISHLEGAMVVVDRFSGEVRAMSGSANLQLAGFHRAMQARRLVGSLTTPVTYLTALSQPNQYRLNTWIADEPLAILPHHRWDHKNHDNKFHSKVMLLDALTYSLNYPTLNLSLAVGLENIINTFIQLGFPASKINYRLSTILLEGMSMTLVEVAQIFQTMASYGNYAIVSSVRSVVNEHGKILYQSLPQAERVIPAQAAYLTLYALQQVVEHGTAQSIAIRFPHAHIAANTSMTNELRDSWFVGIDGKEVAIIWIGRENNGTTNFTSAPEAITLYHRYLDYNVPMTLNLIPPEGISQVFIDDTGNFVCNGEHTLRTLPIWTDHPQYLCKKLQIVPHKTKNQTTNSDNTMTTQHVS